MVKSTLEDIKDRIRRINEHHLEERAKRLIEVGGPGVGGTELDVKIPFYEQLRGLEDFTFMIAKSMKKRNISLSKVNILKKEDIEKLVKEDYALNVRDEINKWKINALADSIKKLWGEAMWSYVYGHFRSCIILLAILVERALKLKLERKGIDTKGKMLGQCISCCKCQGILSKDENNEIVKATKFVNQKRNDVVHANIELKRPESLLRFTGPEHEIVPMRDMPDEIRKCVVTKNGKRTYLSQEEESKASIIYEYKKAAKNTVTETKKILIYLYPDK